MSETNLATEILLELKASSRRWFIAFMVVLVLWFGTIGVFIWYISLPVEVEDITVDTVGGNANYVGRDLSGGIFNGESTSEEGQERSPEQAEEIESDAFE